MSIIPVIWEAEIMRITVIGQPEQNVSKTPFPQRSWAWHSRGQTWAKEHKTLSKNNSNLKVKMAGGMGKGQVVEHLGLEFKPQYCQ
jgi:hypothetical protein